MVMRRAFYFLGMLLCLFFMSACAAGVGALVTVAAFGVEGYEEARVHRPDLKLKPIQSHIDTAQKFLRIPDLPNLDFFPKNHPKKKIVKQDFKF